MKAVVVERPGVLRVLDAEWPSLTAENDVLVRMKAVGICGSDVHIYDGTNAAAKYPRIIGHEMVGVVEQTGPLVRSVAAGDRVIISQIVSCGACWACLRGRPNVCRVLKVRGVHLDGGQQELIGVPESDCFVLPGCVSDADAVMVEPVTIALQCCARAELAADDTLLIVGFGALGSTILKVARLMTQRIIVADIARDRLDEAARAGAASTIDLTTEDLDTAVRKVTDGYGATVTIDAAATDDSLVHALRATGNGGRVVTMGFSLAPTTINQFLITSKELDVRGSRLQNGRFPEAIRLVREGLVDLTGSISHRFAIEDAQAAFDLIASRDPSIRKVALTF
jgi:L-gulonate 5-dehydrogenase